MGIVGTSEPYTEDENGEIVQPGTESVEVRKNRQKYEAWLIQNSSNRAKKKVK